MAWTDLVGRIVSRAFATFNETITYTPPTPPGGGAVNVQGIFRQEEVVSSIGDVPISSVRDVCDLRVSDVSGGPLSRASVTIRGVAYTVASVEGPDDAGVARLVLERVPA